MNEPDEIKPDPLENQGPSDTAEFSVGNSAAVQIAEPAAPPKKTGDCRTLQHILQLKVPLIVKVAQKRMKLQEILKINLGTIIQFEKDAYDHIDLMVNNTTIGLGQPIKVAENFGLRIVQIGDLQETIKSLGKATGG